jgi:hypothetical protein
MLILVEIWLDTIDNCILSSFKLDLFNNLILKIINTANQSNAETEISYFISVARG